MTHICISKLTNIGSDNGLWPGRCQAIKKNSNRNLTIFIHENAFEIVVRNLAAILSQPQCVNSLTLKLILKMRLMVMVCLMELPCGDCHWTSLMISQHRFRELLGAIRQLKPLSEKVLTSYRCEKANAPITKKPTGCHPPDLSIIIC